MVGQGCCWTAPRNGSRPGWLRGRVSCTHEHTGRAAMLSWCAARSHDGCRSAACWVRVPGWAGDSAAPTESHGHAVAPQSRGLNMRLYSSAPALGCTRMTAVASCSALPSRSALGIGRSVFVPRFVAVRRFLRCCLLLVLRPYDTHDCHACSMDE